jgi:hypothetical protein
MPQRLIHSDPEVLQHAIHDGINMFIRDVLIPEGFIKADRINDIHSQPRARRQAEIAKAVAERWVKCQIDEEA